MNLRLSLQRQGDQIVVSGSGDLTLHHVVVWVGRDDGRDPHAAPRTITWSTEQLPGSLQIEDRRFVMRAPAAVAASCGRGCFLGVQAASDLRWGATAVSSEGAGLLALEPGS